MTNLPSLFQDFDRPLASFGFGSWRPLLRQLDDFMSEAMQLTGGQQQLGSFVPACDIKETNDHFLLSFDVPGINKSDIDIEVNGHLLTVKGERKEETDDTSGRTHVVERRYGTFMRTVTLPEGIKPDQVEATYENGVLQVAVPKPAEYKPQKIQIAEGNGRSGKASQAKVQAAR